MFHIHIHILKDLYMVLKLDEIKHHLLFVSDIIFSQHHYI